MLGLYRFRNIQGEIIYIGKSKNLTLRWNQHFGMEGHLNINCYHETVIIEFVELESKTKMDIYELYLINKHNPKYNRQHSNHEENISLELPDLEWQPFIPSIKINSMNQSSLITPNKITNTDKLMTKEELYAIIDVLHKGTKFKLKSGRVGHIKANEQVALVLIIQATLGFKLSEILNFKCEDIIYKENKIFFIDNKSLEKRCKNINLELMTKLKDYITNSKLTFNEKLFKITARNVSMILKRVTDHLNYSHITTHSFRKFCAIAAYEASNHDLEFVRKLLNHSSVAITQRYIESSEKDENEYNSNVNLFRNDVDAK
ncbi:MAG: tyrosine-type recombinase/integrase [Sarcina sp.]